MLKEEWAEEVKRNLAPIIIRAQLAGDTKTLKPWLGEAVYNKLAADIRAVEIYNDINTLFISFMALLPIYVSIKYNIIYSKCGKIILLF